MIDLNKEAEEYANNWEDIYPELDFENLTPIEVSKKDFIAGANSKYVKQQILQAQIKLVYKLDNSNKDSLYGTLKLELVSLQNN